MDGWRLGFSTVLFESPFDFLEKKPNRGVLVVFGPVTAGESFLRSLPPSEGCASGVGPLWKWRAAGGGEMAESMRGDSFLDEDLDDSPNRVLKLGELAETGVS